MRFPVTCTHCQTDFHKDTQHGSTVTELLKKRCPFCGKGPVVPREKS